MKPYSEWSPTPFDVKGLSHLEHGEEAMNDWLVVNIIHTRDSERVDHRRFSDLVARLLLADPKRQDHEVHRFGHWAVGWFEIVLVRPDSKVAKHEQELEDRRNERMIMEA